MAGHFEVKAVILAGGFGTRISEETDLKPKPMIEIGNMPIIWHIMKLFSVYGVNEFIICCGYKGYVIKEYFQNYFLHRSDVTFNLKDNTLETHTNFSEPWKVTLVDTGQDTMTGGRLKRITEYLEDEESFCMTYGDGIADIDISKLIKYHNKSKVLATLTATIATNRFGVLEIDRGLVNSFVEKPSSDQNKINGGFFVLSPKVLDYIDGDKTVWEREPLELLAKEGQLAAYEHTGFWHPMDTLRDKNLLQSLWQTGKAPWKVW